MEEKEEDDDFVWWDDEIYIEPMPGLRLIKIPNQNDMTKECLDDYLISTLINLVISYCKKYINAFRPLLRKSIRKYNFQICKKNKYYLNDKKIKLGEVPEGFFNAAALRGNAVFYKWENIYCGWRNCYDEENVTMNISSSMPLFQILKETTDFEFKTNEQKEFRGNWFLNPEAAIESWRVELKYNEIRTVRRYQNYTWLSPHKNVFELNQDISKLSGNLIFDTLVIHFFNENMIIRPHQYYEWPQLKTDVHLGRIKNLKGIISTVKWCGIVFLNGFVNYKNIHEKGGVDMIRVVIVQSRQQLNIKNKKRKKG